MELGKSIDGLLYVLESETEQVVGDISHAATALNDAEVRRASDRVLRLMSARRSVMCLRDDLVVARREEPVANEALRVSALDDTSPAMKQLLSKHGKRAGIYIGPMLRALKEAGPLTVPQTLDAIEPVVASRLTEDDYRRYSNGVPKWQTIARFAKINLEQAGLVESIDEARKQWKITPAGLQFLKTL